MTSSSFSHHGHGHHVPIRRTASESDISSMSKCSGGTNASISEGLPEGVGQSHIRDGIDSSFHVSLQSSWSTSSKDTSYSPAQPSAAVGDVIEGLTALNIDSSNGVAPSSNLASTETLDPSLPSIGARLHVSGTCQPCLFAIRASCTEGRSCAYCHMNHDSTQKKSAKRPSKKVREKRQQKAVQDLSEAAGFNSRAPLPPGPVTPGLVGPEAPCRQKVLVHL
mmetsp:Transcript_65154/g.125810  ORF Transcript_65154/g.125810 Transcript_65154/m.125810 type:complete len:222 (-) Transcript_65154:61-726(-)